MGGHSVAGPIDTVSELIWKILRDLNFALSPFSKKKKKKILKVIQHIDSSV